MTRSRAAADRRAYVALAVCALLSWTQPAFLDPVRYPIALALSWPARAILDRGADGGSEAAGALFSSELFEAYVESLGPSDRVVPVLHRSDDDGCLILARGWQHGLRRGQRVSAAGGFVGVIDRAEPHLARVRMAGHEECPFAGAVTSAEGTLPVLLKGIGGGRAAPRQGCIIPSSWVGLPVETQLGSAAAPATLLVGEVVAGSAGDGLVSLWFADRAIDAVVVHAQSDGRALTVASEVLHDVISARVLLKGDAAVGARSWMVAAGGRDGLEPGDAVSSAGRLVGRVHRIGPFSSRIVPLAFDSRPVEAVRVVGLGDGELIAAPEAPAGTDVGEARGGALFTRGRGRRSPPPRGLVVEPGEPAAPRAVLVHVFRFRDELDRLLPRTGR